jgi:hypothetical protein
MHANPVIKIVRAYVFKDKNNFTRQDKPGVEKTLSATSYSWPAARVAVPQSRTPPVKKGEKKKGEIIKQEKRRILGWAVILTQRQKKHGPRSA